MPLPAVQHAMKRDGLDPSVMDGDHDAPAPSADGGGGGGRVPLREDPAYAKYFKVSGRTEVCCVWLAAVIAAILAPALVS